LLPYDYFQHLQQTNDIADNLDSWVMIPVDTGTITGVCKSLNIYQDKGKGNNE
jgi:hypothetical protein